jgi:uncharacterized Zn finger protein
MRRRSRWSRFDSDWQPYVPVDQRRAEAERETSRRKKKGEKMDPVSIEGRAIATTFWGKAWCDHMESYHDFENRLPRGRTYVRSGSVIHLKIVAGRVEALVMGSALYQVKVAIPLMEKTAWQLVVKACAGAIDSVVELLAGQLATGVMNRLCQRDGGLLPGARQLQMSCSCPDWATMCKHLAAVLYGVGARLDREPSLLFQLRGVSLDELVTHAVRSAGTKPASAAPVVEDDLSAVFGIDIVESGIPASSQAASLPAAAAPAAAPAKRRGRPSKAHPKPAAPRRVHSTTASSGKRPKTPKRSR